MVKNKGYTSEDIKVLSDREHVRLRTQVYLGNTTQTTYKIPLFINNKFEVKEVEFVPAVFKAVGEIIDNSIDEFAHIDIKNKELTIEMNVDENNYIIEDNGRGVPIDKHEVGKYTPEVVFGQLRSGRNFSDDKEVGVIGQNGVGSACTNYCSSVFDIEIKRDGKVYKQTFRNGAEDIGKASIRNTGTSKTGTRIEFKLDEKVFTNVRLPQELLHNRAIELALTNPGINVEYRITGRDAFGDSGQVYKFKKGFDDIVKQISQDYFKFEHGNYEFYVIFDVNDSIDEQMFTWVNSSLLFDGGLCNTQFLNAFVDKTTEFLLKDAKKNKCEVTKNDVRARLLMLGNLKVSDPQYDSQAKTRLTGPNLRKEMLELVEQNWTLFARRQKDWLAKVLERAIVRHHRRADEDAVKELKKKRKVPGLLDATSDNYMERQLLITEGDSASSMISEARDSRTTASLPLSGKVNNVYGSTVAQLVNMGKIADLLSAIGLVPGQKAVRSNLRYSKIVVATDADYDGSDIFTLLINLFFQYWPELFDKDYEPIIYRLVAPNVCLIKGKERIHFASRDQYEAAKNRYKGYQINYYKGLAAMGTQDWEMILSGKTNTFIPVVDDGNMTDTLELLFGPDADKRKIWLQGIEHGK